MKTSTRRILLILPYVVLLLAVILMKTFWNQKEQPQVQQSDEQVREITTTTIQNTPINFSIGIQGELFAFDKVEIFSEVGGLMLTSSNPFKKGVNFAKGTTLARIDQEENRLSLLSQKAGLLTAITQIMPDLKIDHPESFPQWQGYLSNFQVENTLEDLPEPKTDQEKYFVASKNIYTQFYTIKSAESRLRKYSIYAPFSGVLTEALVQPGTVIRVGQKLGTFMRTGTYEMEAKIPLSELGYIKVGDQLNLQATGSSGTWQGRVKRISDQIDRTSQTVPVYIGVSGNDLREGMYLSGQLQTSNTIEGLAVPQSVLINGNSIYQVEAGELKIKPVEVIRIEGNLAFIRVLSEGAVIPQAIIPGAYDGMKVKATAQTQSASSEN